MLLHALWALTALTSSLINAQGVSRTSRCGPEYGLTCQGSRYGNCCSQYSYCGSTNAYCGTGCQNGWGTCNSSPSLSSAVRPSTLSTQVSSSVRSSSTRTASSATPSSTLGVMTNARCGAGFGFTCQGSRYGDCCSQYSYCGSTNAYCGQGCQQGFGKCNSVSSSSASWSSTRASASSPSPSPSTSISLSIPVASSPLSSSSLSVASSSVASSSAVSSSVSSSVASSSPVPSSSTPGASSSLAPTPSSSSVVSSSEAVSSTPTPTPTPAPTPSPTRSSSSESSLVSSTVETPSSSLSSTVAILSPTPPSCIPANLFTNGDFEVGIYTPWVAESAKSWNFVVNPSDGHVGKYFVGTTTSPSSAFYMFSQTITLPETVVYEATAWVRTSGGSGTADFIWRLDGGAFGTSSVTLTANSAWTKYTVSQTIAAGSHKITMVGNKRLGEATFELGLDDITLVAVNPTTPLCAVFTA